MFFVHSSCSSWFLFNTQREIYLTLFWRCQNVPLLSERRGTSCSDRVRSNNARNPFNNTVHEQHRLRDFRRLALRPSCLPSCSSWFLFALPQKRAKRIAHGTHRLNGFHTASEFSTHSSFFTSHFSFLISHYSLLTTHYSLLIPHYHSKLVLMQSGRLSATSYATSY